MRPVKFADNLNCILLKYIQWPLKLLLIAKTLHISCHYVFVSCSIQHSKCLLSKMLFDLGLLLNY